MRRVPLVAALFLAGLALGPATAQVVTTPDRGLQAILQGVQKSEYYFSPALEAGSWSAPNRQHGLRTFLSEDGLRIVPRLPDAEPWEFTLRLVAVGREELMAHAEGRSRPTVAENRLELDMGLVSQWFVNDPRGLEHGFTLAFRPSGEPDSSVIVELGFGAGSLRARAAADRQSVRFETAAGHAALDYGSLAATDAGGRRLPASLAVQDDRLRIVVDDRDAVYPIVIDPLITQPDWSTESNQSFARLGFAVASAGDVNGDGRDDVIVGADSYDNGQSNEGRIFVFHGTALGLSATPSWTAEGDQVQARFGYSVAAAGHVKGGPYGGIIVGARDYDGPLTNEGWIFVFHGSQTGLNANNTRPVGNPANADWSARGNQNGCRFGYSVASAGDVNHDNFDDVIVGAPEYTNIQTNEGGAFVYYGSSTGLNANNTRPQGLPSNANWKAESNQVQSDFGLSVASAGDVDHNLTSDVIVGASSYQNNFETEGRVYLYRGFSGTGLETTPVWTFDGGRDLAFLGDSVASAGDVNGDTFDDVIVGAPDFTNGQLFEGKALVFHGLASGQLGTTPAWTGEIDQGDAGYGNAVSSAGDVNGDGFDDILVGADTYDDGTIDEGAVFLYLGSSQGLDTTPVRTFEVNDEAAQFGWVVASAGDVQNDGLDDVIIGAPFWNKPQPGINEEEEGGAFAFWGCVDTDRDGVCQLQDNCPILFNPDQANADGDSTGDLCDPCQDVDQDLVCDAPRVLVQSSGPGEQLLLQLGSTMRWKANTTSDGGNGLAWTTSFYSDTAWTLGTYGVGYEASTGAEHLIQSSAAPTTCAGSGTCPLSVYSRASFVISDVTQVHNIFLGADWDDGYVAWINGTEVYRSSEMSPDPPTWNESANSHESSNGLVPDYGTLHDVTAAAKPVLVNGVNKLAIGVWNQDGLSSDLVLVPRLSINRTPTASMRYLANVAVPPSGTDTSWMQEAFADGLWTPGNYGVGFESGSGAAALINTSVPAASKSVYTRARFEVQVGTVGSMFLGADWDDGYVAWINGQEVFRSPQMPGGALTWTTNATAHESSNGAVPNYGTLINISSAVPLLHTGQNVLAVGAWQNSAGLDDLVLVPRLSINETNLDNCVGVYNPSQADLDLDGLGDACDPDIDNDGFANAQDNCPTVANAPQTNTDGDGLGDACDSCPGDANNDVDADGVCAGTGFSAPKIGDHDNCPNAYNPSQSDEPDHDLIGDACDPDLDNDGRLNAQDNCPTVSNPTQANVDGDSNGAACDCNDNSILVWQQPSAITSLLLARADTCELFACSQSLGPCATNANCQHDTCQNFACTQSLGPCTTDANCQHDTCQNFSCIWGGNSCTSDTNCTADFCTNKTCSVGTNPCTTNANCTADFCTSKQCLITSAPCTQHSDCTGGPDDLCLGHCSFGNNICASNSACTADVCRGTCSIGANVCTTNANCTADVCRGNCTIGGNLCVNDSVCTAQQTDVCRGHCSIGTSFECANDGACTAPQTDICQGRCAIGGNTCLNDTPCTQPAVDTLIWQAPAAGGATTVRYDTLRSLIKNNFLSPAGICVETDGTDRKTADPTLPTVGQVFYYLIRVENNCPSNNSNMGTASNGTPHVGRTCP